MYHHNQGNNSNNLLSSMTPFPLERRLLLQGGNVPGDSGLVLSTDAKPRLKWTQELHERFIEAVNQLGGADKATPKTVMRIMGVPGLTLYHLKSHLQKYRLSKNHHAQTDIGKTNNVTGCSLAVNTASEGSGSVKSSTNISSNTNKTMHISEALQTQIEVQRQLHEQLEVQRHLQLRIEAQGMYLQSVLEKAQETLGKQNLCSTRSEAAKVKLSELASEVSNEYLSTTFPGLEEFPDLHILHAHTAQIADCSMDSCLTSCEGPRKGQDIHNIGVGLRTYHGSSPLCKQHIGEDIKNAQPQLTWSGDVYEHKMFHSSLLKDSERTIFQLQRDPGILSMSINARKEKGGSNIASDARRKERDDDAHLEQPNNKRPAIQQKIRNQSSRFGLLGFTTKLDLNANDHNDADPSCKRFDLNGFSWS